MHRLLQSKRVVVMDLRNDYEWDAGHFDWAPRPDEEVFAGGCNKSQAWSDANYTGCLVVFSICVDVHGASHMRLQCVR
jgi:predicted sulfurtransferase